MAVATVSVGPLQPATGGWPRGPLGGRPGMPAGQDQRQQRRRAAGATTSSAASTRAAASTGRGNARRARTASRAARAPRQPRRRRRDAPAAPSSQRQRLVQPWRTMAARRPSGQAREEIVDRREALGLVEQRRVAAAGHGEAPRSGFSRAIRSNVASDSTSDSAPRNRERRQRRERRIDRPEVRRGARGAARTASPIIGIHVEARHAVHLDVAAPREGLPVRPVRSGRASRRSTRLRDRLLPVAHRGMPSHVAARSAAAPRGRSPDRHRSASPRRSPRAGRCDQHREDPAERRADQR